MKEKIKLFIYGGWRERNHREISEERDKYDQKMKMRGHRPKDDLGREKISDSEKPKGSRRKQKALKSHPLLDYTPHEVVSAPLIKPNKLFSLRCCLPVSVCLGGENFLSCSKEWRGGQGPQKGWELWEYKEI